MKKVLSLVLAVVLVLGMSAVAFGKVSDDWSPGKLGASGDAKHTGQEDGEDRPEGKIEVELSYDSTRSMTRQDVRNGKIDVRVRATEGSNVLKGYKIDYRKGNTGNTKDDIAFVKIDFVTAFVGTKDQDYNFKVYLTSEKNRLTDSEFEVSGVFANSSLEVEEGEEYVYMGDTPVVEANDYIRDIKVDLGEGFTMRTKMFDGKKYYGSVSQEVKTEDEPILAQYPSISTVYYVSTIGMASTGEVVQFEDLGTNYYAYAQDADGNLVYIGRTNDKLGYYTKYFLSTKELDVDVEIDGDDDIIIPGDDDDNIIPPITGGDGEAPANVNDNPSTGR